MTSSEPSRVGVSAFPRDASPGEHRASTAQQFWTGVDHSTTLSLDLLGGILVWGGAGWLVDSWLGTPHWFFGFGVLLGFSAGLYLVWIRTGGARQPGTQAAGERHSEERPRGRR